MRLVELVIAAAIAIGVVAVGVALGMAIYF